MTSISNRSIVLSDIKKILDHSGELLERSIFLREKIESETINLFQLIEQSNQLREEGKRLCEWKPLPSKYK